MRIAVCFSGMVRTSNYTSPNLLRYFGDLLPNIDFFMHTWNITQGKPYVLDSLGLMTTLMNEPIIDSSYPIISIMANDYKNFKKIKIESFSTQCEIYSHCPLWYSWAKSVDLVAEYEKEYGVTYDVVLKMRPDMIFPEEYTLQQEIDEFLNNPKLFYIMGGGDDRLNDVYFLSTLDQMITATKIIYNRSPIPWKENEFNLHLINNDIKYSQVRNPSYAIYRDECIGISAMDWLACHVIETYYFSPKKTFELYCINQQDFLTKFLELHEFIMRNLKKINQHGKQG
jgi:hypothetical protein